jgi:hypothetical protein
MTQNDLASTHDDDEDVSLAAAEDGRPPGAVAALVLITFALLRLGAGLFDITKLEVLGEPLRAWDQLHYLGQLATSDPVSLGLALGLLVVGYIVSARDSLSSMERSALLVLAGVSAAIGVLIALTLVRHLALEPHETFDRPYVWHARGSLALAAVTRAVIAAVAFGFAQRYGTVGDEGVDYDDPGLSDETLASEAAGLPDEVVTPPAPPMPPAAPQAAAPPATPQGAPPPMTPAPPAPSATPPISTTPPSVSAPPISTTPPPVSSLPVSTPPPPATGEPAASTPADPPPPARPEAYPPVWPERGSEGSE